MSTLKRKADYFETEDGIEIIKMLKKMAEDASYNTESSFSSHTDLYPDKLIPFVAKHTEYLKSHPTTDPRQYLSNLRLMTRVRKPGTVQ